jgi:hypothetical protein
MIFLLNERCARRFGMLQLPMDRICLFYFCGWFFLRAKIEIGNRHRYRLAPRVSFWHLSDSRTAT